MRVKIGPDRQVAEGVSLVVGESSDGRAGAVAGTYGSINMRPIEGTGETSKNRFLVSVSDLTHPGDDSTNTATWTEGEDVRELTAQLGEILQGEL